MPDPVVPNPPPAPTQTPPPSGTPTPEPTILNDVVPAPTPDPPKASDPPKAPEPPAPANELVGAPEKYENFTLPEGAEIAPEVLTEAQGLFKELNVSQKGAQRLLDFHLKAGGDIVQTMIDKSNQQREAWREAVKNDPQIGPNMTQVKEAIGRLYSTWGDEKLVTDFKEAMNLTGVGDNPAFIKALYKMAQFATEGRPVLGNPPKPAPKSAAEIMYPNNPTSAAR